MRGSPPRIRNPLPPQGSNLDFPESESGVLPITPGGTYPNFQIPRAGDGVRTRDPQLGKLMLCQLSYSRARTANLNDLRPFDQSHRSDLNRRPLDYESSALPLSYSGATVSGAEGSRTPDLLNAIQALSQLSYSPEVLHSWRRAGLGARARIVPPIIKAGGQLKSTRPGERDRTRS